MVFFLFSVAVHPEELRWFPLSRQVILLSDYNPSYLYAWNFNGTQYIASGIDTKLQFIEEGNYPVTLSVTVSSGCTYHTPIAERQIININKAVFMERDIIPLFAEFCMDNAKLYSIRECGDFLLSQRQYE